MQQKIDKYLKNCRKSDLRIKSWRQDQLDQASVDTHWEYYPFVEKYYFELNPSFICEYSSIESMSHYSFIMLRDGFLGLFYFFLSNIKPPQDFDTIILIPKKFKNLVPQYWENNILFYHFDTLEKKEKIGMTEHHYCYGYLGHETFLLRRLPDFLASASRYIKTENLTFISPFRSKSLFSKVNNSDFVRKATAKIYESKLAKKVKFEDNFNNFKYNSVGEGDSFSSIDQDNFYLYDNYLFHFFASRGAQGLDLERQEKTSKSIKIKLSLFHQIVLDKPDDFSDWILNKKIQFKVDGVPVVLSSELFISESLLLFEKEFK